jgi:hypothetical protein
MAPLPLDLQALFDTLVSASTDAAAADITKMNTSQALMSAQAADDTAGADQLAKHQASTAAAKAFVDQFQKDFPSV